MAPVQDDSITRTDAACDGTAGASPDDPAAYDSAAESRHDAIAAAIRYLVEHYTEQPSLEDLAAHAGLHPHHFQRVFTRWAGVSPKRFAQYLTLAHAKELLVEGESVLATTLDVGLSGPSRLHDLFVTCEAMTPGTYKAQGRDLVIRIGVHDSPFGRVLIGLTDRGICLLRFVAEAAEASGTDDVLADWAEQAVLADWAAATIRHDEAATAPIAERLFAAGRQGPAIPVLLRGTNFQIKVWEALLRIPSGAVASYGQVARWVGRPQAVRAVGQAVGANPIAVLIPCHRVIRGTGVIGGYAGGVPRKRGLLAWEAAQRTVSAGAGDSEGD